MSRNWLSLTINLSEMIQNDVAIGLNDIKKDFDSKGLLFNGKFRDHFYKSISNRLTETFAIFEIEKSTKSTQAISTEEVSSSEFSYESDTSTERKRKIPTDRTRNKVTSKRRKCDDNIPSKWSFACAHCFSANGPNVWYESEKKVHKHWQDTHEHWPELPFRFHVDCSVSCIRCGLVESFERIREHTFATHQTRSTIIKGIRFPAECALCLYGCDNTRDHVRIVHAKEIHSLDALNPIPFSYRDLMGLCAIGEHEFRCPHCERSYKTKDEIKQHHRTEHPSKRQKYEKIEFICCLCARNIESTTFLAHVKECGIYKCNKCPNFQAKQPNSFLNHVKEMHSNDLNDGMYSELRISLFHKYSAMKCIFANGLVVAQHNLVHSCYDIGKDFIKLVADSVNKLRTIARGSGSK